MAKFTTSTESRFYFPLYITRGGSTAQIHAKFRDALPIQQVGVTDSVVVLSTDSGSENQGLYLFDGTRYRWVLSQQIVSQCVIEASRIHIYYDQTAQTTLNGEGVKLYRNGSLVEGSTTITTERGAVWVAITPADIRTGNVQSVNDKTPGSNGNVNIGIGDIPGLEDALRAKYYQIAVSLPFDIEPNQMLFYQIIDRPLTYVSGLGAVGSLTAGAALLVTKNGTPVGDIFIGTDRTVIFNMADGDFEAGDVLGINSQDTTNSLSVASFIFNFDLV